MVPSPAQAAEPLDPVKDSKHYEFVRELHDRIPSRAKMRWLTNVGTAVAATCGTVFLGDEPAILGVASGCSGTEIWFHYVHTQVKVEARSPKEDILEIGNILEILLELI